MGGRFDGELIANGPGLASTPVVYSSYGQGPRPVVSQVTVLADYSQVDAIDVDHKKEAQDAVRVNGAKDVVLRNMEIKNGVRDGVDANRSPGLLIENCHIHHFLAGSFSSQADAHGVVVADSLGVTLRNTEIHHVSGDSFQNDPDRDQIISNDILIEGCHFWTSPLAETFNSNWKAGQRPGENAVDTKIVKSGWDSVERMRITIRDTVAHGWERDSFISNKAAFNMKEKIEAVFERVTVYNSEIAFRLRGARGNANNTIRNAVIYDCENGIRAEDHLSELVVHNTTFGGSIGRNLTHARGKQSASPRGISKTTPSYQTHLKRRRTSATNGPNHSTLWTRLATITW